jgi:hypothetical protein
VVRRLYAEHAVRREAPRVTRRKISNG